MGQPAPRSLERISEEEIVGRWDLALPKVSVVCATYNHVDYIEEALSGFLGQDTQFPFEVIIRDDASTDGTTEILERVAAEYPRVIRLIREKKNSFPEKRPMIELLRHASGEFTAICEGDDYWFISNHLERSATILLARPEVQLVRSRNVVIEGGEIVSVRGTDTRTRMFRTELARHHLLGEGLLYYQKCPHGDVFLLGVLLAEGVQYAFRTNGAVYRHHDAGISQQFKQVPEQLFLNSSLSRYWTAHYLRKIGLDEAADSYFKKAIAFMRKGYGHKLAPKHYSLSYRIGHKILLPAKILRRAHRLLFDR